MGFYVRKSFRMGPVRLNLSKHGLGMSLGLTGARVGVTSEGHAYVHVGRGGLYLRHGLGGGHASPAPTAPHEAVVVHEQTGATFPPKTPPVSRVPLRDRLVRPVVPTLPYHLLLLGAIVPAALASDAREPWTAALEALVAAGLVAVWAFFVGRAWLRNRAGEKLGELLATLAGAGKSLSDAQSDNLRALLEDPDVTAADRAYQGRRGYLLALQKINDDRVITDDELRLLGQLEALCALPEDFRRDARLEIFHESYLEAVADHEFTEEEERGLDHLREALAIPDAAIAAELGMLRELREIRRIRGGELPHVQPDLHLPATETCYYRAEGRILKERTLQSFQREGQRYRVRGLVVDREGELLITCRRLLLVHEGTTQVRLDRILHVDVDCDQNLVTVVREDARSPIYLTTPDALRAGAILAAAAGV